MALVLTINTGEAFTIGDDIIVRLVGNNRVMIDAPRDKDIMREKLLKPGQLEDIEAKANG